MFCQVILVGNVGRDPELRYTNTGTAVCDFSLAVNRRRKVGEQWEDETVWFTVTCWGRDAEFAKEYVHKGRQVLVESDRLEAEAYVSNDGRPQAKMKVTVRTMRLLGGRADREGGSHEGGSGNYQSGGSGGGYQSGGGNRPAANPPMRGAARSSQSDHSDYNEYDSPSNPDDIPF
jgi:single-strand DNA-binding protein